MVRTGLSLAIGLTCVAIATAQTTSFHFDFGAGKAAPGFTRILPATAYNAERGYGFEHTSGKPPLYFSVRVPEEGNYRVTVTLGDPQGESDTTVKAELRRLMLEKIRTARGSFERRTFIVNIRTPKILTGGEVRLKDREKTSEAWAWDDKLTLEFTGARPSVARVEIEKADGIPTLYIAGD